MKNVQIRGGYILHIGEVEGTIKKGDTMILKIDAVKNLFVFNEYFLLFWSRN